MLVKLIAKDSTSGDSRRLFLQIDESGTFMKAWDEGTSGTRALPVKLRKEAANAPHFEITPSFYRKMKRVYVKQ